MILFFKRINFSNIRYSPTDITKNNDKKEDYENKFEKEIVKILKDNGN